MLIVPETVRLVDPREVCMFHLAATRLPIHVLRSFVLYDPRTEDNRSSQPM